MIRKIINHFRISRFDSVVMPVVRVDPNQLQPVQFRDGCTSFHTETIHRLEHLYSLGVQLRETQEAMAAECCQLLDCDPLSMSTDAEFARSIVLEGEDVSIVVNQIHYYREARRERC